MLPLVIVRKAKASVITSEKPVNEPDPELGCCISPEISQAKPFWCSSFSGRSVQHVSVVEKAVEHGTDGWGIPKNL